MKVLATEGQRILDERNLSQHKQNREIQESLFKKFLKFISKQRMEKLRLLIKNFHGRNFPISYKSEYNFYQQWQTNQYGETSLDNNLLEDSGLAYFVFSVVFMILNVSAIWVISFQRYFDTKAVSQSLYIYEIQFSCYFIDVFLIAYYKYQRGQILSIKSILKSSIQHIITMIYFISIMCFDNDHQLWYPVEIIIMVILYLKAADIYKYMKIMEIGLNYQNQIKIFNLLSNIFIQAHVFAVILFSASKLNPDKNWIEAAGLGAETALTKYIYAFYFASTTMLTIGYGDITPRCPQEIVITILIEIVAVISFGYLLNEMGHTLSKMREQSEQLERDLQTISKVAKYYNLERTLQNRAKNFLVSNQVRAQELKVEDQSRVLMKLNQELRQEINHQNSLTVIKSCIFFLCHWSKNMQSEIARRLEKRLFAPNEKLVAANGSFRVYVVKRGRVDVFMNRYGNSQEYRKLLKVINTATHSEVADNIYGYTTAFSNRPVRLEAVAKEFTSTYSVTREEFLQCVRQNIHDFEYFHEVKCRIDQSSFCEQWETPAIKNIREHYAPSKIIVIKKYRNLLQNNINQRMPIIRRLKQRIKILQHLINKTSYEFQSGKSFVQNTIEFVQKKTNQIQPSVDSNLTVSSQSEVSQASLDSYEQSITLAIQSLKSRYMSLLYQQKDNKKLISHNFQKYHEFNNFFRFNNRSYVLNNLERSNCCQKQIIFFKQSKEKKYLF